MITVLGGGAISAYSGDHDARADTDVIGRAGMVGSGSHNCDRNRWS